jgi:hypothetical protein
VNDVPMPQRGPGMLPPALTRLVQMLRPYDEKVVNAVAAVAKQIVASVARGKKPPAERHTAVHVRKASPTSSRKRDRQATTDRGGRRA